MKNSDTSSNELNPSFYDSASSTSIVHLLQKVKNKERDDN